MNILVTGANGFIGKNLCARLRADGHTVFAYDADGTAEQLQSYCAECEFVCHLAGVNRPPDPEAFMRGNYGFTTELLAALRRAGSTAPVLMTSSIQAELDNDYGKSKRAGEEYLSADAAERGIPVYIFRLPNVFGKWCRPFYNSVVATFCHQIARGQPVTITDRDKELTFVYIDDLIDALIAATGGAAARDARGYCEVPITHRATLGFLADTLAGFRAARRTRQCPRFAEGSLEKKLYSTYLSYLPEDEFSYPLESHVDARGSFTEFLRLPDCGQVSVNVAKPGVVKGNHWHHTKNEKFLVVCGRAAIRFRRIGDDRKIVYYVDGERPEVVDIPCGYTHNIENVGEGDLVTLMWANEPFDPERPDTYYEEV